MKSPLKKKITNPKNFFLLSFTFQLPGGNSSLRLPCGRGNAGPRETSARLPGPIYGYEIQGFFMISFIAKQGADVKANWRNESLRTLFATETTESTEIFFDIPML
jgi:hypothetical protein